MRSWSSLCNHAPGVSPCNDADFDDELVHLCNLPVKRDEPIAARSYEVFCSKLIHLCNHPLLPVPLPLAQAVPLAVGLIVLPVCSPVALVPCAPPLLGRSLVLPVVGVVFELFLVPPPLPRSLAVSASAVSLIANSGMGEKPLPAVRTRLLHGSSTTTSVGKSVDQKCCAGKEDGCYREDRGLTVRGYRGGSQNRCSCGGSKIGQMGLFNGERWVRSSPVFLLIRPKPATEYD